MCSLVVATIGLLPYLCGHAVNSGKWLTVWRPHGVSFNANEQKLTKGGLLKIST